METLNIGINLWFHTVVLLILLVAAFSVGIFMLYVLIRPRFTITVNCWFCGEDSSVAYCDRNSFHCCHCEQYNGFTEDGDYNQPISAQYSEALNSQPAGCEKREMAKPSTVLCERCCQNETMKIKQISAFVPFNETTYDAEIAAYKRHLDTIYRLCDRCDIRAKDEILRQDQLISLRLAEVRRCESRSPAVANTESAVKLTKSTNSFCMIWCLNVSVNMSPQTPADTRYPHKTAIFALHAIASVCGVIVAATCLTRALDTMSASLPPIIHESLSILCIRNRLLMCPAVGGLLANLLAKYFLTKERIYEMDGVGCVAGLLSLLVTHTSLDTHPYFAQYIDSTGQQYAASVVTTLYAACCITSLLASRSPRSHINISIRRLSLDSDRQNLNQSNDEVADNNTSFHSASSSQSFKQFNLQHPKPRQNIVPTFRDIRRQREMIHPHKSSMNRDVDFELDSISLGSLASHRSNSNLFGSTASFSPGYRSNTRHPMRNPRLPRPLISPARFHGPTHTGLRVPDRHRIRKSPSDLTSHWSQASRQRFPRDVARQHDSHPFMTQRMMREYSDDDNDDRNDCCVSTTTPECHATAPVATTFISSPSGDSWWTRPAVLVAVLAFSVSTNILLVAVSLFKS